MYALATWAGFIENHAINFDRIATLTASAASAVFVGEALILWLLGMRKDYGPRIPLIATISALIAFIAATALPVANSVTICTAMAATFLLNGKVRTFILFCIGAVLISFVIVLVGSQGLSGVLGSVLVGIFSALFTNLAFAALLLATVLRSCDMRTENEPRNV